MLVSGGQILAIDHVITDGKTVFGDGVNSPLSAVGGGSGVVNVIPENGLSGYSTIEGYHIGISGDDRLSKVIHDNTLKGDGTSASELGVNMSTFSAKAPLYLSAFEAEGEEVTYLGIDEAAISGNLPAVSSYLQTEITAISSDTANLSAKVVNMKSYAVATLTDSTISAVPDVENPSKTVFYITPDPADQTSDNKMQWVYATSGDTNVWEQVGLSYIDLDGYVKNETLSSVADTLSSYTDTSVSSTSSYLNSAKYDVSAFSAFSANNNADLSALSANFDNYVLQVSAIPADAENGKIVEYVGETNTNYTNGYFYKFNKDAIVKTNNTYIPATSRSTTLYVDAPSLDRITTDSALKVIVIGDHITEADTVSDSEYTITAVNIEDGQITISDGSTLAVDNEPYAVYEKTSYWSEIDFGSKAAQQAFLDAQTLISNTSGYGYSAYQFTSAFTLSAGSDYVNVSANNFNYTVDLPAKVTSAIDFVNTSADVLASAQYIPLLSATIDSMSGHYLSANALDTVSAEWNEVSAKQDKLTSEQLSAISSVSGKLDYGNYLSANALDNVSAKWNEVSAISATSGYGYSAYKFTSAFDLIADTTNLSAYVLDGKYHISAESAQNILSAGSGIDATKLADNIIQFDKEYQTVNDMSAYYTSAQVNSAFLQINTFNAYTSGISSLIQSGVAAEMWISANADNLQTKLSAGNYISTENSAITVTGLDTIISGNNGISAVWNSANSAFDIGLEKSTLGYFYGSYDSTANNGDILTYDNYKTEGGISADEDGYIIVPSAIGKFTVCVNENVIGNANDSHQYLLNKITLNRMLGDTSSQIAYSQNFYATEVGTSNLTIALTVNHADHPNSKYFVQYEGSNVSATDSALQASISLIEEVVSLSESTGGSSTEYIGVDPINITEDNKVKLNYSTSAFEVISAEDGTKVLSIKEVSQYYSGVITPQTFVAMENVIDSRVLENYPIAAITDCQLQLPDENDETICMMHLFRPNMNFTLKAASRASFYVTAASTNAQIIIGVADINKKLLWLSNATSLDSTGRIAATYQSELEDDYELNSNDMYYLVVFGYRLGSARIAGISFATMNGNAATLACGSSMGSGNKLNDVDITTAITGYTGVTEAYGRKLYVSFENPDKNEEELKHEN